ncbi:hypothetical protein Tco_0386952 [Tanacetum coccineum]
MVADLRYFNSLEHEVDTLKSQLETQKTQFLNEIDRLSREYYYADHMNAILGVYTDLDEFTNLQCDYVETWEKCEHLEKELSKVEQMSKRFEALQKTSRLILNFNLQQCKEKIKNDKSFKENQSNVFLKEREQYFEIQDLKAQLQDKGIAIRVIPTTSVSKPQLKSNQLEDRVMPNNSQEKRQNVEDHRRHFKFSNNKMFVTACNDSLNAKTSNVNLTRQPMAVPVSTREPNHNVNQSVATFSKKTVTTDSTFKKSRNITRKLYEQVSKTCSWWAEAIAQHIFTSKYVHNCNFLDMIKTPYHFIKARKPSVKFFPYCYLFATQIDIVRDGENLDKMRKEKEWVRSRQFLPPPGLQCSTTVLEQDSLSPGPQSQENVPQIAETVTTSNKLELLYSPMFSELLNGTSLVVSKSSAVHAADASNKRQQQPDSTSSTSTLATTMEILLEPTSNKLMVAQVDQGSQIKMIQVKEMMQDNDLKNSKSKDKGSKSRSQSMDEQSHYKQDKTITRQSINVKRHIFNIISGTEEFEERDLNIGGDYQYAVSIKEDTAYPCLHSPKTTKDKAQYAVSRETQYAVFKIWNEYNILEDIKRVPIQEIPKTPIQFLEPPMKKVIKGEFVKIKDVKVEDVPLTCDTPLETRGDDEVELTDEESFDDEDDVAKVFRIDTNIFDYETPLCSAFKEFNYLLKVDPNLLTNDIIGFKTYEYCMNDWIYE